MSDTSVTQLVNELLGPRPLTQGAAEELTEAIRAMFARYIVRALSDGGLRGDTVLEAARPMLDFVMAGWAPQLTAATASLIASARTIAAREVAHGPR